jgi:hypothetical protein
MGSGDDASHLTVVDGWNLFLFEQCHKLILARVGACRASANDCGGQHHRGANQSVCKAGDTDAHGSHQAMMSEASPSDSWSRASGRRRGLWMATCCMVINLIVMASAGGVELASGAAERTLAGPCGPQSGAGPPGGW